MKIKKEAGIKEVFVWYPITGDKEEDTKSGIEICKFLFSNKLKPYSPYLVYSQFMDLQKPNDLFFRYALSDLITQDELFIFTGRIKEEEFVDGVYTPKPSEELIKIANFADFHGKNIKCGRWQLEKILRESIKKRRKVPHRFLGKSVFISHPIAGDTEKNIEEIKEISRSLYSTDIKPLVPHLSYLKFMDETKKEERELGLTYCKIDLERASELKLYGSKLSSGMKGEIELCKELEIPFSLGEDKFVGPDLKKEFEDILKQKS